MKLALAVSFAVVVGAAIGYKLWGWPTTSTTIRY